MNYGVEHFQKIFFSILDFNNDGMICERDLFKVMEEMKSSKLLNLLNDDIQIVIKYLIRKRNNIGKGDSFRVSVDSIN